MASAGDLSVFSVEDVREHVSRDDCWIVIHGKVYNLTPFMEDHPGGDEVLMRVAGQDGSEDFDDVGHSETAIQQMKDFYVGECPEAVKIKAALNGKIPGVSVGPTAPTKDGNILGKILQFLVPLVLLGIAVALRKYVQKDAKA